MRRSRSRASEDALSFTLLIVGTAIIGIVLLAIVRLGKGLFGVVLAGLAAALLIYWLREIRRVAKQEMPLVAPKKDKWNYDVIDAENDVTVVAEVPGPEEQVKVELNDKTLQIVGGDDFRKSLTLSGSMRLSEMTYINGILNVRFKKSNGLTPENS